MRINVDPLQVAEAHYVEPSSINMVTVTKDYAREVVMVEAEGFTKGITKDSTQMLTTTKTTDNFVQVDNMIKATKVLVAKLQDLDITKDACVKVSMVEL